ncbi:four helix bundle protein [Flavobacterium caeni]|uniref:Four helix bundle protein n=1 Tax=Flavobacterium caeni TaxID=490189 RepID=A0A1G5G8S6_9FLAO|nr:four helix bundle protein [Flavobacterium caeni]SCY47955.1 four helix bundle protein [Flavobacterium caeni]
MMSTPYNLEERTFLFAKNCRQYIRTLPKTVSNIEDAKQLTRSSGSIGANYIEANENLGIKDFKMHLRIARKEAKETRFWLRLLHDLNGQSQTSNELILECEQLQKILSSIINK